MTGVQLGQPHHPPEFESTKLPSGVISLDQLRQTHLQTDATIFIIRQATLTQLQQGGLANLSTERMKSVIDVRRRG